MNGGVRLALTVVLAGAMVLGAASSARAASTGGVTVGATFARVLLVAQAPATRATGKSSVVAASPAERDRLRGELARVNLEIDNLKRSRRGLGDDYVLRRRMADAEALARRLTEVEAQLGKGHASSSAGPDAPTAGTINSPLQAPPEASDTDDRAALDAKADILADQARRLTTQADALEKRIGDLRQRGELRRRAGQLDRDPFSPLEQAKRRIALGSTTTSTESTGSATGARGATNTDTAGGSSVPPTSGGATTGSTPGATGVTGVTTGDSTKGTSSVTSVALPPSPVGAGTTDAPGSVAAQFRGLLDASTLMEIRRLESPHSPAASLKAMEHALAALRTRAATIDASAKDLRRRARTTN